MLSLSLPHCLFPASCLRPCLLLLSSRSQRILAPQTSAELGLQGGLSPPYLMRFSFVASGHYCGRYQLEGEPHSTLAEPHLSCPLSFPLSGFIHCRSCSRNAAHFDLHPSHEAPRASSICALRLTWTLLSLCVCYEDACSPSASCVAGDRACTPRGRPTLGSFVCLLCDMELRSGEVGVVRILTRRSGPAAAARDGQMNATFPSLTRSPPPPFLAAHDVSSHLANIIKQPQNAPSFKGKERYSERRQTGLGVRSLSTSHALLRNSILKEQILRCVNNRFRNESPDSASCFLIVKLVESSVTSWHHIVCLFPAEQTIWLRLSFL